MNDKTRIRIAVPTHLYESVKKQLTLKESKKRNFGSGYTPVKEKKMPTAPKAKVEGVEDDMDYEAGQQLPDGEQNYNMAMEKRMAKLEKAIMEMHKQMMSGKKVEEKKSESEEEEDEE
jgi:hypothetical protein